MTTRWRTNETGKPPRGATGKRVKVKLRNGYASPGTWPVERQRWSLEDGPFDIVQFQVVGDD